MIGWLKNLLQRQQRSGSSSPSQWLIDWISGGKPVSSGAKVNETIALKYTPFWASVRVISGTLGALPFKVYERQDAGGKRPIVNHTVYRLLHERPNEYMDAVTFIESRQAHVLTYGNGYAEIQRDGAGRPVALWPLLPDKTERKVAPNGVPYYEVRVEPGRTVALRDENVLHIKGLGFDGYTGYHVVQYHKEAIGYGIGVKEYGARFFGNDGNPGATVSHPSTLSNKAYKHLQESLAADSGLEHAHRVKILEEGMKWETVGVEPAKAQALEVQKWTVDDCARIFQIPPHKIGSMEFSKYNNVEQLQIDFVCTTMLYWFRKWEQEINFKLFGRAERQRLFCEISADALLRGNVEARTRYYAMGRQWGYLSINDIRALENLNPIGPAGDIYLDPLNMKPAGTPDPDVEPNGSEPDDDIARAMRALLTEQWRRILTKTNAAARKKARDNGFWRQQQDWAYRILRPAVQPWAAWRRTNDTDACVTTLLGETLCENAVHDETDAEPLARRLMDRIGGNHANNKTD